LCLFSVNIMGQYLQIHRKNPQVRLIKKTAEVLRQGGVIVYPTDSTYAVGCLPGKKEALGRICRIRNIDEKHNFTLMCRDIKEVSKYAWFDTPQFRLLKAKTPGPYTFIMKATKAVPRRLLHPKKKTIGIRIPDCKIVHMILEEAEDVLITTTLILPDDDLPVSNPECIKNHVAKQIDVILDAGVITESVTTVVDLTSDIPVILRHGIGDFDLKT